MPEKINCRICNGSLSHEIYLCQEMMFGTREEFTYGFCDTCGTLQIREIPKDLSIYYKTDVYYSFNNKSFEPFWRKMIKQFVAANLVGRPERYPKGTNLIDRMRIGCEPWIATISGLALDDKILDVGCGQGSRLSKLARLGFSNLSGIDPFLPAENEGTTPDSISLFRGDLTEHEGQYDLVTIHHSLEHVPDPLALLQAARDRLTRGGSIFVRIPLLQPLIWERYGTNWSQIDAPRHLYLFTPSAFVDMAAKAGLKVEASGTDTMAWSLSWSEAYARGISMSNKDGTPNSLPFSKSELAGFSAEAQWLNHENRGDQGYFVLQAH